MMFSNLDTAQGKSDTNIDSSNSQQVTLGIKNFNYFPEVITVKAGQPVSLTLDNSVTGCFRSFNIRDLGVSGYSSSPDNKIMFTPAEKGTYKFSCSMGMGYGTLIVE